MSTKVTVFYDSDSKTHLFEEMSIGDIAVPATLELMNPEECSMTKNVDSEIGVTVCIDSDIMDRSAVAWCKHRNLRGAVGGAVGSEFGVPDCVYE